MAETRLPMGESQPDRLHLQPVDVRVRKVLRLQAQDRSDVREQMCAPAREAGIRAQVPEIRRRTHEAKKPQPDSGRDSVREGHLRG